mmetsp:Transcript_14953/g.10857  ORF Transcript_14953/g.10857 Transcript_14953/m.10857 type:complete len:86 (-) Transcript_14953:391-648(-)
MEQSDENWELRSVVAVFRHGDRTPKQKMKMKTKNEVFIRYFDKAKDIKQEVKLKTARELQKLLDITKKLMKRILEEKKVLFPNVN